MNGINKLRVWMCTQKSRSPGFQENIPKMCELFKQDITNVAHGGASAVYTCPHSLLGKWPQFYFGGASPIVSKPIHSDKSSPSSQVAM